MGPKKATKGKKKAAEKPAVVSTVELENMNAKLREELERERQERNWFQVECEHVKTYWEISQRELEEKKCELRNMQTAMEEADSAHQLELKVFRQKIKHLLNEQQASTDALNAEHAITEQLAADKHHRELIDLRMAKRTLKQELKEHELDQQNLINNLKLAHAEAETALSAEHERKQQQIESKYQQKLKVLNEELLLRRRVELHELEERKNVQLCTLVKNHEKALDDMKTYYNEITLNNLGLINLLKDKVEEVMKKDEILQVHVNEVTAENRHHAEELKHAKGDVSSMLQMTAGYEKNKFMLKSTKQQLKTTSEKLHAVELENEIIEQRFKKLEIEKNDLYKNFIGAIQEVNQKAMLKNLLLEKKLKALVEELEIRETQITEIIAAANLDPVSLVNGSRRFQDVIDIKNRAIRDLQYELGKACKAHNDLMHAYEARLKKFDIRIEETGFHPLTSKVKKQVLGAGPSGLVSLPN